MQKSFLRDKSEKAREKLKKRKGGRGGTVEEESANTTQHAQGKGPGGGHVE